MIGFVAIEPNAIDVNRSTEVRVTAIIEDARLIPRSVKLQRRKASEKWTTLGRLNDDGVNGAEMAGDGVFALLTNFNEPETGNIHLRVAAKFRRPVKTTHLNRNHVKRVFSELNLPVGVRLAPGTGGTINGPNGTNITIEPNSIDYEVLVGIAPVASSDIVAPLGGLPLLGAVEVIFQPTAFDARVRPPTAPLQISVLAPPGITEASKLIVTQQLLTDFIGGPEPGLQEQLVPLDVASVVAGRIVTQTDVFPGILAGGLFAIVQASGSGFATGTVSEENCFPVCCQNIPRPGVTVSNNTNTLVSITNGSGQYIVFISGGPFTVTGFDPFRGSSGSASGDIAVDGSTVTANIQLSPLLSPLITRDGIRNGGFERCDLSSWATSGVVTISQQLGPTSTGEAIQPTEGQCMVDINTGAGAVGDVGSSLKQSFMVPAGVEILQFDFVSEEFPEFVGSRFDDTFRALITTPNGQTTMARVSVNQSGGFTEIGDCFFPGGDDTCAHTGWRGAGVDISGFAGTNTFVIVDLLFSASDVDDDLFDTHVLVDNFRFGTVFVDTKIINGANASQASIQTEVLRATEILSQAGLNVRLGRNPQTINDPGGLLDINDNESRDCRGFIFSRDCRFIQTDEERHLLALLPELPT